MATDEELMMAYRRGEAAAFEGLVHRHWSHLEAFFMRLLRDRALVGDALTETFFKLHCVAPGYTPHGRFTTLLYTIAYREAMNLMRARRRQGVAASLTMPEDSDEGPPLEPACPESDSEARALAREELARIDRVLATLAEVPRAVFLLYHCEGMSTREIAETLEIPGGSVRAYLTLTRRALREALDEDEAMPVAAASRR